MGFHKSVLLQISKRQAPEDKDRYFGACGLINHDHQPPQLPNYSIGLAVAYRKLIVEYLKWTGSLDILFVHITYQNPRGAITGGQLGDYRQLLG